MTIEARGLRTARGELDLVCRLGPLRVVVEVKTARAALPRGGLEASALRWRPGLRLDGRRLTRLRRAARALGASRVDLVEIWVDPGARRWVHTHHAGLARPLGPGSEPRPPVPAGVPTCPHDGQSP
jgi:Holliday junction resolvase-like predicted endonuclease